MSSIPTPGRTIAIGDIHGCLAALDRLLEAIAPQTSDTLVALGDYVDRGPDSCGVLSRLMELEQRCRLVPLLGNHEEMMLVAHYHPQSPALNAWLHAGGTATLDSYGIGRGATELPESHVEFLQRCVAWHETETHLFLHANYDANLPPEDYSNELLRWQSLREHMPMRHYSAKTVIVGHTAQKDGRVFDRGYLKCIDTYCYGGQWLTALDVASGQLWQADVDGQLRGEVEEESYKL